MQLDIFIKASLDDNHTERVSEPVGARTRRSVALLM